MPAPSSAKVPPEVSAREAGLRYVTDAKPGLARRGTAKAFTYVDAHGKPVREKETLGRIKRLVIPPAWTEVWISPLANGHLQATGKDARGRKQYRYHPDWRLVRDESKYGRVMAFGRALPALRRRVEKDLQQPGLPRAKVLATVVKLLETTLIRVGNEEYARTNHSYGLTTMRRQHATVKGSDITFAFKGKSGKRHEISVHDRQLAKIVRQCQELPDQEIFEYEDDEGNLHDVKSQDVNAYLHEVTGEEFTAKDFRTWSGTVLAAIALREFEQVSSQKEAKGNIVRAIESVSKLLGNTPSICRKCYVHPEVLESYLQGATIATLEQRGARALAKELRQLKPEEAAVMALLQERLKMAKKSGATKAEDLAGALEGSLRKVRAGKKQAAGPE